MKLSDEERQAVALFKDDPARQEELRDFLREQGTAYGRAASDRVCAAASPKLLLSNSGRCALADVVAKNIRDHEKFLRRVGHDDHGIELFVSAAKHELRWLGV